MKEEAKSNNGTPQWKEATDLLLERIANLNAAGNDGFEGLMRDMLVELTGMPFSLAKSGHQGGSDVRSEPANFFKIGLEAKGADADSECNTLTAWLMGFHGTSPSARSSLLSDI